MNYLWYLVPFALLVAAVAWESGLWAVSGMATLGAALVFLGGEPLRWIASHPLPAAVGGVTYLLVGALWSLFKYYLWLRGQRDAMLESMALWRSRSSKDSDLSVAAFGRSSYANEWRPTRNKSRLMFWMVWWVPSVFWTLTHDLFRSVWRRVYDLVAREYERLADLVIRRNLE